MTMPDLSELMSMIDGLRDVALWDLPPPDGLTGSLPPVFRVSSSGVAFVMMPIFLDGRLAVEVFGFDEDGIGRVHEMLALPER